MKQLVGLVGLLFLSANASAQEGKAVFFMEAAGWSVYSDKSNNNACYATTGYEGGTYLRFGFLGEDWDYPFFIAFGNDKWRSIEPVKEYDVTIQMDREAPWQAVATGWHIGEMPYLVIPTDQPNFFREFARKHGISLRYNNQDIARLSLKGSSLAEKAVVECQAIVNKLNVGKTPPIARDDPFDASKPRQASDDPFAL